jgi:hypothetical protein
LDDLIEDDFEDGDYHAHDLLKAPEGKWAYLWHIITLPLKVLFMYTLIDCRVPSKKNYYLYVITMSIVYLAGLSYVMIVCCDYIGNIAHHAHSIVTCSFFIALLMISTLSVLCAFT